jgi:hypothetical protein
VFARHDVEFIVVGGVAAVLGGAPISTFDLDIVHRRTPENVSRLFAALAEIDARYRDPGGRVLRPQATALEGIGHHLLMTTCGPVDVLGQIGEGAGYDDLLPDTLEGKADGVALRVLGLRRLIAEKERMNRDKDRAVLAILRRTLDESG